MDLPTASKKNDITSYRRFRCVRKIHGSFFLLYGDRKDPWIFRTLRKRKILRHIVNLGASGRSMDPFLVRVDLRRIHGSSNLSKNKLICEKLNKNVTYPWWFCQKHLCGGGLGGGITASAFEAVILLSHRITQNRCHLSASLFKNFLMVIFSCSQRERKKKY